MPISFETAYAYEALSAWPSLKERAEFWRREDVPAEWHPTAEPNPCRMLSDNPAVVTECRRAIAEWREGRLAWLKERAEHG